VDRLAFLALIGEGLTADPHPSPALRLALLGWMSFTERATLDWLEHRDRPPTGCAR
jgi:hypothetical protein